MRRKLVFSQGDKPVERPGVTDALLGDGIRLVRLMVRRRQALIVMGCSAALLAAIVSLVVPSTYTSRASLLPTGKVDKMADLKSLAGLSGLTSQDESSSELFPTILMSRTVFDGVLGTRYQLAEQDGLTSLTLNEYLNLDDPERLRHALAGLVSVDKDRKTGVISLAVETTTPELSQQVARQFIAELDQFNTTKRRSQAGERARYLEQQVNRSSEQLRCAEDSLESFQKVNRNWIGGDDPEVGKIVARLTREVEIQTQGYGYLRQQLEMARLDAQKDLAVVSVLDEPSLPTIRTSPRRTLMTLFGAVMGFALAMLWILVREYWGSSTSLQTKAAITELKSELSVPIRWRRPNASARAGDLVSETPSEVSHPGL